MNSGFSDYQDLINTTTSGQAIDDIRTELTSRADEVKDNADDIVDNSAAIMQNSDEISNQL